MNIFNKILHSYAIYCRKVIVKILKCYLIPKKSYDTLSKGAIFLANPVYFVSVNSEQTHYFKIGKFCLFMMSRPKLNVKGQVTQTGGQSGQQLSSF